MEIEIDDAQTRNRLEDLNGVIYNNGWQPIETAPKDGTTIITWEPDGTGVYFEWWDEDSWHYNEEWGNGSKNPTHWMPLPKPPVSN